MKDWPASADLNDKGGIRMESMKEAIYPLDQTRMWVITMIALLMAWGYSFVRLVIEVRALINSRGANEATPKGED